ncbi:MAG: chemotaxis protein CheX [Chitinispirillaceae bacterium]|nr:chemotaxis protein CheX [Chitinispirillaceae bacterium]
MDVSYINPFIIATTSCFSTMMSTDIHPGDPSLKTHPYPTYDISGVIGLSGSAQGSISLSFPLQDAENFVKLMLSNPPFISEEEMSDGVGEIVNIIAGNAKQHLTNFDLSISLPNVIIGKKHTLAGQSGSPTIVVPFSGDQGKFAMEVSLKTR